jgi:adenylate cyclase class IV
MSLEIEAKFLEVNLDKLRKLIKKNGGKKVHKMVMYKRYVFHLLTEEKGYIRTRDENGRVTITLKKYPESSKFAQEYEILLDKSASIEDAKNMLLAQGFKIKAQHETLREKWTLNGCPEIAIDTLPGIPTYVELECKNETEIKRIAKLLEFNMKDAKYGPYVQQYIDYYNANIDSESYPVLTFNNIDKELNPKSHPLDQRQKDFLQKIKKQNLDLIKKNKIKHI